MTDKTRSVPGTFSAVLDAFSVGKRRRRLRLQRLFVIPDVAIVEKAPLQVKRRVELRVDPAIALHSGRSSFRIESGSKLRIAS
jgi:hypothetical protein